MVKTKKQKCDGCCDCTCGKEESVSEKPIKVYFCPKCESKEVGYVFRFGNAFGVIPKMECKKCGFSGMAFPQLVVNGDNLKRLNARTGVSPAGQNKLKGKKK